MGKCKLGMADCGHYVCCFDCRDRASCAIACNQCVDAKSCVDYVPDSQSDTEMIAFRHETGDLIAYVSGVVAEKKRLDAVEAELKTQLLEAMKKYNVKKFENDQVAFTYTPPTTRTTFDTKAIKKDMPDLFEQYSKTTPVAAAVRITVKEG